MLTVSTSVSLLFTGQPKTLAMPQKFNLSVETKEVRNRVEAVLTWQLLDVLDNASVHYTLTWFRQRCDWYADSPYCHLPSDAFVETMAGIGKEKVGVENDKYEFG